MTVYYCWWCK